MLSKIATADRTQTPDIQDDGELTVKDLQERRGFLVAAEPSKTTTLMPYVIDLHFDQKMRGDIDSSMLRIYDEHGVEDPYIPGYATKTMLVSESPHSWRF